MNSELKSLRDTLTEVNALLDVSDDEPTDLLCLKRNLIELIDLKESELLEERKNAVLMALESAMNSNMISNEAELSESNSLDSERIRSQNSNTLTSFGPGAQCSLPGWTSRGHFINQNAIVAEELNNSAVLRSMSSRVRVFLVNPTRLSQVPCNQFLTTGICSSGSICRFSHGIETSVEELREWEEPDPKAYLQEGHLCLALHKNGSNCSVWHHARIQHTDIDSETCVVEWFSSTSGEKLHTSNSDLNRSESYSELDSTVTSLPLVCVHPIRDEAQHLESLSPPSSPALDDAQPTEKNYYQDKKSQELKLKFYGISESSDDSSTDSASELAIDKSPGRLGAWEVHTRGIGTRLLTLMGYTGTGGLGRNGMGLRLPVCMDTRMHQVVLDDIGFSRPSIDRLIELRSFPHFKRRHTKVISENFASSKDTQSKSKLKKFSEDGQDSVFEFLNGTVFGQGKSGSVHNQSQVQLSPKNVSFKSGREINIQLYGCQRQISAIRGEISKTEQSLRRNETCDRRVAAIASRRLSVLKSSLLSLRKCEQDLSIKSAKQKSVDKLRVF